MKPIYSVLLITLLAGCAPQPEQSLAPVAAAPASGGQIISGPAPVPTPGSMGGSPNYATSNPSQVPTMPNDNPGSGIDLGRSRTF